MELWVGAGWGGVAKASAMSQAADIIAKLIALPDQLKWSWGPAMNLGIQTKISKPRISAVSRSAATRARMPERMAAAASRKQMAVKKIQKTCPGGSQAGTQVEAPRLFIKQKTAYEMGQMP